MADYHSPTVVQPFIPEAELTVLERLVLGLAFDVESDGEGLVYFHSWCGPSSVVTIDADELRAAHAASIGAESGINDQVASILEQYDKADDRRPHDCLDIELDAEDHGWHRMFQHILRRTPSIDEIVVIASFTCSKMRPDGFGGSVTRITADAIQFRSTYDVLETMRNSPIVPSKLDAGGHETRRRIEAIAAAAGWDSFTLLLLIARWVDRRRQTETLIDHLDGLVSDDDG